MHTNWCVLIEISLEIGMINFLCGIIGHCTKLTLKDFSKDVAIKLQSEYLLMQSISIRFNYQAPAEL